MDQSHNVWANMWTTDRIAKYDPSKGEWTMFDLLTRGTESASSHCRNATAKLQKAASIDPETAGPHYGLKK